MTQDVVSVGCGMFRFSERDFTIIGIGGRYDRRLREREINKKWMKGEIWGEHKERKAHPGSVSCAAF